MTEDKDGQKDDRMYEQIGGQTYRQVPSSTPCPPPSRRSSHLRSRCRRLSPQITSRTDEQRGGQSMRGVSEQSRGRAGTHADRERCRADTESNSCR